MAIPQIKAGLPVYKKKEAVSKVRQPFFTYVDN